MAGRGRGRGKPRQGSKQKETETQVEGTLPDSVPAATDPALKGTQMRQRRPLQALQGNGATPSFPSTLADASNCMREYRCTDIGVQQVCDAIDAEVQARSEVIKAIASAQLHSITSQLQLLLSRLPVNVRNMALPEFLKSCPNVMAKEMEDGRIQLQRASPAAVVLKDSKKNLSNILSMARDSRGDVPGSLFNTPAFGPVKTSGEELSWPEYHAKLQASGHIAGFPDSIGTQVQQDSALSLKTGLGRYMTPKTVRIPKEGEVLLSLNGSPLGQFGFTPGPNFDSLASGRKIYGSRVTRSTTKRSIRDL